jgi:SAM-dependent methyltransferase
VRFGDGVESYGFLHDPEGRATRARRIVALLRKFHSEDLGPLHLLDVGCSAGLMTREVSGHVSFAIGVDPDLRAMTYAASHLAETGKLAFACSPGESLPFADRTFDVVLCNHVYEHARDPHAMMREIARVLRPEGVCWFAGGHTLQLVEPHYRLPLLALLPRPLASWTIRATGRGDKYSIAFLPPWRLRELFAPFRRATCLTAEVLREPQRYGLVAGPMRFALVRAAVRAVAPIAAILAPTQLWLLHGAGCGERRAGDCDPVAHAAPVSR